MNDGAEPRGDNPEDIMPPSHDRILFIMGILGILGGFAGAYFISPEFGLGVFVGTVLAFANYFWLKATLRGVLKAAAEGHGSKTVGFKFIGRYFALASIIAIIYASGVLPIVPVVLGIAGFGFATVVDGLIRIFTRLTGK